MDRDVEGSRADTIIGVVCFVLTVAATALSLRIYTRMVLLRSFGVDDAFACAAFPLVFSTGFLVAWNTRNGLGRHIDTLSPEIIEDYNKTFYTSIVMYNASLVALKMAFLTQYYRVLAVTSTHKKICIGAIVLVGAWALSQVLVEIFICSPIKAFWDTSVHGKCIPNYPQWYINAAGNIISDIVVFILPLPVIRKLQLERYQKFILTFIFCLGFFTCLISFIRIRFLNLPEDFTWANVESAGWSVGELCSGLTCLSLTSLRPLISKWFPGLSSQIRDTARRLSTEVTRHSHHDPEKGTLNRSAARSRSRSRPTLSRHTTHHGPIGEDGNELHVDFAGCGTRPKESESDDSRPLVLQAQGELSSEDSIGMPIMRPDQMATVETKIGVGTPSLPRRRSSSKSVRIRVSTEIERTESRRQ